MLEMITTIGMPTWKGERSQLLNITQRTTDKEGMLSVRKIVFSRREHANWLYQL